MFIDSHAHIFSKEFQADVDQVVRRAAEAGVDSIICPGTDLDTSRAAVKLAERFDCVYAAVGFHPHDASKGDIRSLEEVERLSHHRKVVAIGEIGLDYHYNYSPPEVQREVFGIQIEIARRRNLPIIIHSREAESDTLDIVAKRCEVGAGKRLGVFHCFPGDVAMAEEVVGWGFSISIPGPVTFSPKKGGRNMMAEVVSAIPLVHILLETDCPYLAPVPHRGKRNEPAFIPLIAKRISELRGISIDEVGKVTTEASMNLFGLSKQL
jgi:TatD DNase family protein